MRDWRTWPQVSSWQKIEAEEWAAKLELRVFDYRSTRGYYDSQSGAVIGEFLRGSDERNVAASQSRPERAV